MKKPPLLFLHGGPGLDHSYFLPYFGGTDAPYEPVFYTQGAKGSPGIDGLIAELHNLARTRGPSFVFAHSFGAALALEYVRRHGEGAILGLILCSWIHDTKLWLDDYCRRFRLSPQDLKQDEPATDADFKRDTLAISDQYFCPSAHGEGRSLWEGVRFDAGLYRRIRHEFFDDFDATDVVRSLHVPTLSLTGVEDNIVGVGHVRAGATLNPAIRPVEIMGAGHFPFVEKTEAVSGAVAAFIRSIHLPRT